MLTRVIFNISIKGSTVKIFYYILLLYMVTFIKIEKNTYCELNNSNNKELNINMSTRECNFNSYGNNEISFEKNIKVKAIKFPKICNKIINEHNNINDVRIEDINEEIVVNKRKSIPIKLKALVAEIQNIIKY
jgi:hypothetical protein